MAQYAWALEVRRSYEEEYGRRHDEIRPGTTDTLEEAGIRNYTIFRHGLTLFGFFETDDVERTQEYLAPIMKAGLDPATKFPTSPVAHGLIRTDRGYPDSPPGTASQVTLDVGEA